MSNDVVQKKDELSNIFDQMKGQWSLVLPRQVTDPERFTRMCLSCVRKNPKLIEAIKTPQGKISTLAALSTLAELGIEPDGRRAHLIPYKDEVTLVIDYKGMVELVMRSGLVSNIHADKVCDNDEFEYNMGNIEKHKIDFKKPRGEAYAYYCVVTFKDGTRKCEVMPKEEVEKVRQSSYGRNADPWTKWYDEMAKKTVFKRLSKWLKISSETAKAIDIDNEVAPEEIVIDTPVITSKAESAFKNNEVKPESLI